MNDIPVRDRHCDGEVPHAAVKRKGAVLHGGVFQSALRGNYPTPSSAGRRLALAGFK